MDDVLARMRQEYGERGLRRRTWSPIRSSSSRAGSTRPAARRSSSRMHDARDRRCRGQPSARTVLLKAVDRRGLTFYTNLESRKARELAANPKAALLFWWPPQGRQVRFEGEIEPVDDAEADAYFATRPRGSQIGAWASAQSNVVADRAALDAAEREIAARFADRAVPRPPFWGGYRLVPRASSSGRAASTACTIGCATLGAAKGGISSAWPLRLTRAAPALRGTRWPARLLSGISHLLMSNAPLRGRRHVRAQDRVHHRRQPGIGHATAKYFVDQGWRAITCSRDPVPPECARSDRHSHITADLADVEHLDARSTGCSSCSATTISMPWSTTPASHQEQGRPAPRLSRRRSRLLAGGVRDQLLRARPLLARAGQAAAAGRRLDREHHLDRRPSRPSVRRQRVQHLQGRAVGLTREPLPIWPAWASG